MPDREATIALVTGASRGIGHASCLALARAGLAVAVGYRSDPEGAEEAVAKATSEGVQALAVSIDVRDEDSVEKAFKTIEGELGPVRVLVNNAGFTRDGLAVKYSTENWDATLDATFEERSCAAAERWWPCSRPDGEGSSTWHRLRRSGPTRDRRRTRPPRPGSWA